MISEKAAVVIERLEAMDKNGESYSGAGRVGNRNPIKADVGLLIHGIVLAEKPKRILELGTAYGLSGCYLASALPDGGELVTMEFFAPVADQALKNFNEAGLPVAVVTGDVLEALPKLEGPFDMVFLDAEKKSYLTHLKAIADAGLLSRDCLVLADNVIDRAQDMLDFHAFYVNKPHVVLRTQAGLLVMRY